MNNDLDQFDPGEDVTDEFDAPRRPSGMVVSVRIGPEESEKLINLAEESGRTVSQVARQAIRSFLSLGAKRNPEVTVVTADPQASLMVRTSGDAAPTEGSSAHAQFAPV